MFPPIIIVCGLLVPAFAVKYVYDDWLLPAAERGTKAACSFLTFSIYHQQDQPYDQEAAKRMEGTLHRGVDVYLHYLIFSASILAMQELGWAKYIFVGANPFVADICAGMVLGAALQGNPKCPAQAQISKNHLLAMAVGAVNGGLCCASQAALTHLLYHSLGLGSLGTAIAFALNTAASAHYMCAIEGKIARMLGLGDGRGIFDEQEKMAGQGCGCQ